MMPLPFEVALRERYGIDPEHDSLFTGRDQTITVYDRLVFVQSGEPYRKPEPYVTLIQALDGTAVASWYIHNEDTPVICTHISCICAEPQIALDMVDELYCYAPQPIEADGYIDDPHYAAIVYHYDTDYDTMQLDFVADFFHISIQLPDVLAFLRDWGCTDITYHLEEMPSVYREDALRTALQPYGPDEASYLSHGEAWKRVQYVLEGLAAAETLAASIDEFAAQASDEAVSRCLQLRRLPQPFFEICVQTDVALATARMLRDGAAFDQNALTHHLIEQYLPRTHASPQTPFEQLIKRMHEANTSGNEAARVETMQAFADQTSPECLGHAFPIGAYYADDLQAVVTYARRAAALTHIQPEAQAGTIAVAVATAWAWRLRVVNQVSRAEFLDMILPFVPQSAVRTGIEAARELPAHTTIDDAVAALGNGSQSTVEDTVPLALWCAGEQLDRYKEAIWLALNARGDYSTLCAIVGGIVVMRTGIGAIPHSWRDSHEPLPKWASTS
jgi:ADP-ribosylglycohydrolase